MVLATYYPQLYKLIWLDTFCILVQNWRTKFKNIFCQCVKIHPFLFLSARKRQLALLVIVFLVLVLVLKSLINSNYPKSTPTHSEPPTIHPQRISIEFPKNSQRIPKEFQKNSQENLPKLPNNSDGIPQKISNSYQRIQIGFPKNSQKFPKEFPKNSQRILKEFPPKLPKNSQTFPKNYLQLPKIS